MLRLGAGAAVRVFNGSGDEFESVVEAAAKDVVQVRLGNPRDPAPEAAPSGHPRAGRAQGRQDGRCRARRRHDRRDGDPAGPDRANRDERCDSGEGATAGAMGARRDFIRQAVWPRDRSTDSRAGHLRCPDPDSAGQVAGRARDHAGRAGSDQGRGPFFRARRRNAEIGNGRRRSGRWVDAGGNRERPPPCAGS